MSGQEQDSQARFTTNFRAEMDRVGLPNVVIARGIGVSERQITRWRGGQIPQWRSVEKIASYFGREPEWFFAQHSAEPEPVAA